MTPPDSGEREVCGSEWRPSLGPHYPCVLPVGHKGPHEYLVAEATVVIPFHLAQRILAALKRDIWTELANELRARMPK